MIRPTIGSYSPDKKDKNSLAISEALRASSEFMSGQSIALSNLDVEIKDIEIVTPYPGHDSGMPTSGVPGPGGTFPPYSSSGPNRLRYFKRYDGSVEIVGSVSVDGSSAATLFTLPEKFRPSQIAIPFAAVAIPSGNLLSGIITDAGVVATISFTGFPTAYVIQTNFMPASNEPDPLPCFPVTVKTRFRSPPVAVMAINVTPGVSDAQKTPAHAYMPSWTFGDGEIQILDIPGLEYNCRQTVKIIIFGA